MFASKLDLICVHLSTIQRSAVVSIILCGTYYTYKLIIGDEPHSTITKTIRTQNKSISDLPNDLLLTIISFIPYSPNLKLIHKSFAKLCEKHNEIQLIQAKKLANNFHILQYKQLLPSENVWKVDSNKNRNELIDAAICCYAGDTINLCEGVYDLNVDTHLLTCLQNKFIRFVAKQKVVIKNVPSIFLRNAHFENVHFVFDNDYDAYETNPLFAQNISLKQCTWNVVQQIHFSGNVYLSECNFICHKYFMGSYLTITPWCDNMSVIGCTFTSFRCGGYLDKNDCCVYIAQKKLIYVAEFEQYGAPNKERKLNIIGNTFENNRNYPIVLEQDYSGEQALACGTLQSSGQLFVKHNILKGFSILDPRTNEAIHPNKIYKDGSEYISSIRNYRRFQRDSMAVDSLVNSVCVTN